MPKRNAFNIHDLYPADYCFDWETFDKDPEGYQFTETDIAYFNAMELARYEEEVPMTPYEKNVCPVTKPTFVVTPANITP